MESGLDWCTYNKKCVLDFLCTISRVLFSVCLVLQTNLKEMDQNRNVKIETMGVFFSY